MSPSTPHKPNSIPRPLAYLNTRHSPLRRASINSSMTHRTDTGCADMLCEQFARCFQQFARRATPHLLHCDDLDPRALAEAAMHRIQAIPEIDDDSSSADGGYNRARLLRDLRAERPSRPLQKLRDAVAEVVAAPCDALTELLNRTAETAPHALAKQVAELRNGLRSVHFPVVDFAPIARFDNLATASRHIAASPHCLPDASRPRIADALLRRAADAFQKALERLALREVNAVLQDQVERLLAHAEAVERHAVHCGEVIEEAQKLFDDDRTRTHHDSVVQASSNLVLLEGPDETTCTAALMQRLRCKDPASLADAMLERLESALRICVAKGHPSLSPTAPLGTLLAYVRPSELCDTFRTLVLDLIDGTQSVYVPIRARGTRRVAVDLFRKAAPLCNLSSRDHPRLNVTPVEYTLIRLPVPTAPADTAIRQEMIAALKELDKDCIVIDTEPDERAVVVTRTDVGWSIAFEESNHHLLQAYAACARLNHPVHLFDVCAEAVDGKPIAAFVELASKFSSEGDLT